MHCTQITKWAISLLILVPALAFAAVEPRRGIVTESMEAAGYSYIKLDDGKTWIATGQIPVQVGDEIEFFGGMNMTQFQSKALDRTFDTIIFVERVSILGAETVDTHHGSADPHQGAADPHQGIAPDLTSPVPPLDGGLTIAAILDGSADLTGTAVRVRGRVIKATPNIMGKNWITLVDGSRPDTQLIFTSSEMAEPGEVVIASGTVKTDVDLGYGYHYDVLVEETSFAR